MTSGNGAEQSDGEPSAGSIDGGVKGSIEDPIDGEDIAEPAPERPRQRRRKAGAVYRPV